MESKAVGLLRKLESIRDRAEKIYDDLESLDKLLIESYYKLGTVRVELLGQITTHRLSKMKEVKMILEEYRILSSDVYKIVKETLPNIPNFSEVDEAKGVLHRIIIQSNGLIGLLKSYITPISAEDADRLNKLRSEVSDVTDVLDINFEKNLIEAINECEKGHHLASALITARVINYALDQISGQTIEDKIKSLQNQNIIKKSEKGRTEEEEFVIKACKKARNIFSHDIKIFANPSDSLGMLGDCLRLLRMLKLFAQAKGQKYET